jgi:nicotinamidase-related amidase
MGNYSSSRLLQADNTLLMVVDIQEKLLPAMENPEKLIEKVSILLKASKALNLPVLVSEQVPAKLGTTTGELQSCLPVEATILHKTAFGCGQDSHILTHLSRLNRKQVILCGLETHVCVNQTAHQLMDEGYQVHLMTDASQSRHKRDYKMALIRMTQSGIIPSTVESALFELMSTSEHPAFRLVQSLVKSC